MHGWTQRAADRLFSRTDVSCCSVLSKSVTSIKQTEVAYMEIQILREVEESADMVLLAACYNIWDLQNSPIQVKQVKLKSEKHAVFY